VSLAGIVSDGAGVPQIVLGVSNVAGVAERNKQTIKKENKTNLDQ